MTDCQLKIVIFRAMKESSVFHGFVNVMVVSSQVSHAWYQIGGLDCTYNSVAKKVFFLI